MSLVSISMRQMTWFAMVKTELASQMAVLFPHIGWAKNTCLKTQLHLQSTLNTNVSADLRVGQNMGQLLCCVNYRNIINKL